ncbi:hypothetical protein ZIOFF_030823 [Zingiber officinale]|uniref:AB hydrolase-1 domain-containing protein n=1 Tax=Zingiber officinale TaxID=94328 RepID=A0A8J5H0E9_ZINOF|nr:hypothetical protein ZIOFF_030823 [Zingiber officinale]
MAGPSRKISAASARSHTRKKARGGSSFFHRGMLKTLSSVLFIGIIAWSYQAIQPPPAKICGSQDDPRVTAPRIKLKDGRHLAYLENGVPKETAKYKIVFIHGFDCCRYDIFSISPALIEELGIYLLSFDRAGYGESDPNPKMTEKSTALDIEELADQLGLGTQFFVIGFSMGGEIAWTTLKYIPHRLAGAAIVAPAFNYWWHGFPSNLTTEAYNLLFPQDKWALRAEIRQQGEYVSLHRDLMLGFQCWEFSPLELDNPFPNNEGSVHLWHGVEDRIVPVMLSRYISQKLSWVHYHELPDAGHMFPVADGMSDAIVKALLLGNN